MLIIYAQFEIYGTELLESFFSQKGAYYNTQIWTPYTAWSAIELLFFHTNVPSLKVDFDLLQKIT